MDKEAKLRDTDFIVEANSFETLQLWKERGDDEWIQGKQGFMVCVGELDGRPINISLLWNKTNGMNVLFWEAISQVVDYALIDKWFDENCNPKYNNGSLARTNAGNFHLVLIESRSRFVRALSLVTEESPTELGCLENSGLRPSTVNLMNKLYWG